MTLVNSLELIPVVMACIAVVTCSIRYAKENRKITKLSLILSSIASAILIVAQTSWWDSVLQNDLMGTEFANKLWLAFNFLTTTIFIIISLPSRKK